MHKHDTPGYVTVETQHHPIVACVVMLVPITRVAIIVQLTVVKEEHVVKDVLLVNAVRANVGHAMHAMLGEQLVKVKVRLFLD